MDIVIVDDETKARKTMRLLLGHLDLPINIIGEASSVHEAKLLLQGLEFDVLLLDIELMDGTGFDILEQFPDLRASVVFTTAYDHYSLRALKKNAIDYILKPIGLEELQAALKKCHKVKKENVDHSALIESMRSEIYGKRITVTSANKTDFIDTRNIIYCQSDSSYATLILSNGTRLTCSRPLKHFEELLTNDDFFRINKSQLINLKLISQYRRDIAFGQVTMDNGDLIKVSRRKRAEFNALVKEM